VVGLRRRKIIDAWGVELFDITCWMRVPPALPKPPSFGASRSWASVLIHHPVLSKYTARVRERWPYQTVHDTPPATHLVALPASRFALLLALRLPIEKPWALAELRLLPQSPPCPLRPC
jgi:hypothetical protein